jgi:sugar phosphate isomerase/epimerase
MCNTTIINRFMTTRRDFLKNLTLLGAVAATSSSANVLPPAGKKMKPAIQLWSVREAIAADLGMSIISTHSGISEENASAYATQAAEAGLKHIVLPSFNGRPEASIDDFKIAAAEMNQIGEITRKSGITFGYHNHDFEFREKEGKLPYDILLSETDPELVSFQMDIFWVKKGGQDPLAYFKKHPGRFRT